MLFPICCLSKDKVRQEAIKYCENILELKENIFTEAKVQKLELAVKEAVNISNEVVKLGDEIVREYTFNEKRLKESMPIDPELFKSEVEDRVLMHYYDCRSQYIDTIQSGIDSEMKVASDSFSKWLIDVSSQSTLKNETQSKAETTINIAVRRIDKVRKQELEKMSKKVVSEIKNTFKELYSSLPFKISFKAKELANAMSELDVAITNSLEGTVNGIGEGIAQETTATIIGAAIGIFLGPLGAIAGGFLGGHLFGKPIGDIKEEIWQVYNDTYTKTYNNIIEVYDKDINSGRSESYVNKLIEIVDEQIKRYNDEISRHIKEHYESSKILNKDITKLKLNAYRIKDEIELLQLWRNNRRSS